MGESNRRLLAIALAGAALSFAGCSSDAAGEATAKESTSVENSDNDGGLSGHDLEIAKANCEAYDAAVGPTRNFHDELGAGDVTGTIGDWMTLYETAQAGLELEPVPTAPELNQAITAVMTAYDAALAKLDGYTMATDMSNEVIAWDRADAKVQMHCRSVSE